MKAAPTALDLYRELLASEQAKRESLHELARRDVNTFAEHVLGITQAPLHEDMHAHMDAHPWLVMHSPPELGKTTQVQFVRPLFEWGRESLEHGWPRTNWALVSATADISDANLEQIAEQLKHNTILHEVFPRLRMKRNGLKRTRTGNLCLWLQRGHGSIERDPHAISIGIEGNKMGRRLDRIVLDDIHNDDNTGTAARRLDIWNITQTELVRGMNAGGKLWYIGHVWYSDDVGHRLIRESQAYRRAYDIEQDLDGNAGSPWPVTIQTKDGKTVGWTEERKADRKRRTPPIIWMRMYRCQAPDESAKWFPGSLLQAACERGRNLLLPWVPDPDVPIVSGVDLSTGEGADETTITTGALVGGAIRPLDVRGGVWGDPAIVGNFQAVLRLFPGHRGFLVETNSAFKLFARILQRQEVLRAYGWTDDDIARLRISTWETTAKNKHDSQVGIRALALDFSNYRVTFASDEHGHPRAPLDRLVMGLSEYDPASKTQHTSDYVISYWLMCEHLRMLGLREQATGSDWQRFGVFAGGGG